MQIGENTLTLNEKCQPKLAFLPICPVINCGRQRQLAARSPAVAKRLHMGAAVSELAETTERPLWRRRRTKLALSKTEIKTRFETIMANIALHKLEFATRGGFENLKKQV